MDSLYIVMPAYNEEENIRAVVRSWYPVLEGKSQRSRLVVADFGSRDRTREILCELQSGQYPQLEVLETGNQFHGPKLIALYDYAIKNGADYIFQTDSDGQTNPAEFEDFWRLRSTYDAIFGNRTVRGDGRDRALVEKVVCLLLKLYFGVSVPDANAPFRLMRAETLKSYLYMLPSDFNIPNIMLTTYFVYYGKKVRFKKISFKPRTAGKNSMNLKKIFRIGCRALGDFRSFRKDM